MSQTYNFWGCVPPGQTGLPAGTYFDLMIMTLNYGPSPKASAFGFHLVNITTPATCSMTAPGSVAFGNYLAFGGALASTTSFGATCANLLPYTVSVSPVGGVIVGLNYALSLTPPAGPGGTSLNARGSGALQTYTINRSIVAGQAGICSSGSCVGTAPHTLTLSY